MSASADIETNLNGLVVIHYLTELDWTKLDRSGIWQLAKFQQCLPYKFRAAHICDTFADGSSFYHSLFVRTLDAISRVRILYHSGKWRTALERTCIRRESLDVLIFMIRSNFLFATKQDPTSKLCTNFKHLVYRNESYHWISLVCQRKKLTKSGWVGSGGWRLRAETWSAY